MIFLAPPLSAPLQARLGTLGDLRRQLGAEVSTRTRWIGSLRRQVRASSIESSTSIEGFSVSPDEALALTSGRRVPDQGDADQQAVACYARAMDHVGTMAVDPSFRWLDRAILDLKLESFDTYLEVLLAFRGTYHRQFITRFLDSVLLKNAPGALLAVPTEDQEGAWSGPYEAGGVWAVLDGHGTVTADGRELAVTHPGAYELLRHDRHRAGVLSLEVGAGVTCHAVCFTPGLAP